MFSKRTGWETSVNALTEILKQRRSSGKRVIDLTISNPTACGFSYPEDRIRGALSSGESLSYDPDPRGVLPAREAVVAYYRTRGRTISTDDIFLTASTSESYSLLLKLLCDPGDAVLVPRPSYPLFDYLCPINDVRTIQYTLSYDTQWRIDTDSVRKGLLHSPRAVILLNPHNPTGSFITEGHLQEIGDAASTRNTALIVDEVFRDYGFGDDGSEGSVNTENTGTPPALQTAHRSDEAGPLTFLLNGLSKTAALPQMKIGWIVVSGGGAMAQEARTRLEILNDAYLSANTPAQVALGEFLAAGEIVRPQILGRVRENYATLRRILGEIAGCSVLHADGGWNAVVRLPDGLMDEECVLGLLRDEGVYCYPGYFFDFESDNTIILSLLPNAGEFADGVTSLGEWINSRNAAPSRAPARPEASPGS